MKSIASAYMELAEDEGTSSALDALQRQQLALEELAELGTETERNAACLLLKEINATIGELLR